MSTKNKLRKIIPVKLYPLVAPFYKLILKRELAKLRKADIEYLKNNSDIVPNADLRFRVVGLCTIESFLKSGQQSVDDINVALRKTGKVLSDFSDALDFGCGCGRALIAFRDNTRGLNLYGTDIDKIGIDWADKNLKFAKFSQNKEYPPLNYESKKFDLCWSVSIFTHLDEEHQFKWLKEINRVMKPGGIFIASVHGPNCWNGLPEQTVKKIKKDGFIYAVTKLDEEMFPKWYQTAWHTESYIRDKWSEFFEIVDYIPKGCTDYQDTVVMRNK